MAASVTMPDECTKPADSSYEQEVSYKSLYIAVGGGDGVHDSFTRRTPEGKERFPRSKACRNIFNSKPDFAALQKMQQKRYEKVFFL